MVNRFRMSKSGKSSRGPQANSVLAIHSDGTPHLLRMVKPLCERFALRAFHRQVEVARHCSVAQRGFLLRGNSFAGYHLSAKLRNVNRKKLGAIEFSKKTLSTIRIL